MGPFLAEPLLEELRTVAESPAPLHDARRLLEVGGGPSGWAVSLCCLPGVAAGGPHACMAALQVRPSRRAPMLC